MGRIDFHEIEQGSEIWQEARRGKFTGSNADKLLSSFGAGDHAKAIESDFKGSFATDRGHTLEPEAIELYETIKKEKVNHCGFITNSDYPDCLFSPDGYTNTHLIEVKCFLPTNHMAIYDADSWLAVPKKILAQIHYGMLISELPAARLIIYNPKLDPKKAFKIIEIPRVDKIQDNFKRILKGASNALQNTAQTAQH